MHPEIEQRLGHLEFRRQALMERVRELPPEKQTIKPDSKSFSPAEVIMHMALSELSNVKKIELCPPAKMKGKKAYTTFIFRNVVGGLKSAKKIGGTPSDMVPSDRFTLEQAEREWDRARKLITGRFGEVSGPDDPIEKNLLFGTLSASDLLTLMEAHQHYHETRFPKV